MSKSYKKAPAHFKQVVGDLMRTVHCDLMDHKTRVDMLLVFAPTDAEGSPVGPALSDRGVPCLAKVSIVKLKDRVLGRGDAEILLDGDSAKNWDDDRLRSILDHELTHLELTGAVDDIGRPKFKIRPHDVDLGWFDACARRNGRKSIEVRQAEALFGSHSWRQLYLPGIEIDPSTLEDNPKPSMTKAAAAKQLGETFGAAITAADLTYASIPYPSEDGETRRVVEAWVDQRDRAVVFAAGQVLEITSELALSARWSAEKGDQ